MTQYKLQYFVLIIKRSFNEAMSTSKTEKNDKKEKKEKKKYKQQHDGEEGEEVIEREIKMKLTKKVTSLRAPVYYVSEKTQVSTRNIDDIHKPCIINNSANDDNHDKVKMEIESTHDYDDDFIKMHPLNKSTQVSCS